MRIIDERNMQKTPPAPTTKTKQNKDRKNQRCDTTFRERVRANRFCCAFKLGFLQLVCRASSIFKLRLQRALPINLKERE